MRFLQYGLILLASALAINLCMSVPFYFSWDMELVFIQDMLMMQSHQLPIHMHHPSLGMNWLYLWLQDIASLTGYITDVNINNIGDSFEPLVLVAEQLIFIRTINALFCIFFVLVLWKIISETAKLTKAENILTLLMFLSLPAIWRYDILLVRTETFSLFFWALALYYTIKTAKEAKRTHNYLAGFFAALSFFTKIQSIILVLLLPVVYLLVASKDSKRAENEPLPKYKYKIYTAVFLALCVISYFYEVPQYVVAFANAYYPNKFFVMFLGLLWFVFYYSKGKFNKYIKFEFPHNYFSAYMIRFLKGSIFVLLLPLISLMSPLKSLEMSLATFKMVFVRTIDPSGLGQASFLDSFPVVLYNYRLYFVILLLIFSAIIFNYAKNLQERFRIFSFILLILGLLAHIALAVRPGLQDGIWVEAPVIILIALACLHFEKLRKSVLVILLVIFSFNVYKDTKTKDYNTKRIAYFDSHIFFEDVYNSPTFYGNIFSKFYKTKEEKDRAVVFASQIQNWKNILSGNFVGANLSIRDISALGNDLVVHLNKLNSNELSMVYRPDMLQTIYIPQTFASDLTVKGCQLLNKSELKYKNETYIGYTIRSEESKGRNQANCIAKSENLSKGLVVVSLKSSGTFRASYE